MLYSFNPVIPNIHIQILHTDLHTICGIISIYDLQLNKMKAHCVIHVLPMKESFLISSVWNKAFSF